MPAKPAPRPRPEPAPAPAPPPFPTVAVKIAARDGIFNYGATNGAQSWSGAVSAPTREAALLDVFGEVRAAIDGPIRFAISLPPTNPIWRYTTELTDALNCLVERAGPGDQHLIAAAVDLLAEVTQAPLPVEPQTREQLTVATDGSVRKCFTGYGWLASNGRYRLRGTSTAKSLSKHRAVLFAELRAIDDATRSLPGHPLTVLTDSKAAATIVRDWMAGLDIYPPGFRAVNSRNHPLSAMREAIHCSRDRLSIRWIKGHCGDPLNEGADALARLASRYARGDRDLTEDEYTNRAAGLAAGFAEEFARRGKG